MPFVIAAIASKKAHRSNLNLTAGALRPERSFARTAMTNNKRIRVAVTTRILSFILILSN
jgi:hypothetical protein